MNKQQYKELGKKGSDKRWAKRYEMLVELSKKVDKQSHNKYMKWPTKYLVELLRYVN